MTRAIRKRFEEGVQALWDQEGAMTDEEYLHQLEAMSEMRAEMAAERYYEDRGWMDTFIEEDMARRGGLFW